MTEAMAGKKKLYYGAQYFRPPSPKRENHRRHLEQVKHELGFDVVSGSAYCYAPAFGFFGSHLTLVDLDVFELQR